MVNYLDKKYFVIMGGEVGKSRAYAFCIYSRSCKLAARLFGGLSIGPAGLVSWLNSLLLAMTAHHNCCLFLYLRVDTKTTKLLEKDYKKKTYFPSRTSKLRILTVGSMSSLAQMAPSALASETENAPDIPKLGRVICGLIILLI